MIRKNLSDNSIEHLKKNNKKLLIISKLKDNNNPRIIKHSKLIFNDPSIFLKLPNESEFNYIIGKKNKVKNQPERASTKNQTSNFVKMLARRVTRMKSSGSVSLDFKNIFESFRKTSHNNTNEDQKSTLRKKNEKEISNIFSKFRKMINKNETNKRYKNIILSEDIPSFMKKYINNNLSQQEKALKCREEYNNIFKQMEQNITQAMYGDNKSFQTERKNSEHKYYETGNLFKNSVNNHRIKIEKIKLYNRKKKKKKNLIVDTHIRNWEMSLRRPKNFIGLRKGYLNISSDKRPIWIIATEKYPVEEEKIINPNINYLKMQLPLNKNYIGDSNELIYSPKRNKELNLKKYNSLQINGKKLIDLEEAQAEKFKGNIKIKNLKYDVDSTKDLLFKMNCTINKFFLDKKLSLNEE